MALKDTNQMMLSAIAEFLDTNTVVKAQRPKVVRQRKAKTLQRMFRNKLSDLSIESMKEGKPWLAEKNFILISNDEALGRWVDDVLADQSRWIKPYANSEAAVPVVAVDTENWGLDTRVLYLDHMEMGYDPAGNIVWTPKYAVNIEIAGVCLSVDGITGVYVPVNHEDGNNCTREGTRFHLQRLFDVAHLVFYNAKYDREVLRLTLGLKLRPYPHYEDVQVLKYINDPKAKLNEGDKTSYAGDAVGLKGLSWKELGYKQIELDHIAKVSADWTDPVTGKTTSRMQYVPFMWVPTELAVWYAAGDAICTWLLWDKFRGLAQSRLLPHVIDGELIDSLTWMERQRFLIDVEPHSRMVTWHERKMLEQREELRQLAIEAGWQEAHDANGELLENTKFSVDSNKMLPDLLYRIKGLKVVKMTDAGKPSTDKAALLDLMKMYPEDTFLKKLKKYKEYVALHPENLAYDRHDNSARIYLKQSTVAGGRLAASGGNFHRDGGFSLNPQAIKKVEGNWYVKGRLLTPDRVAPEDIDAYEETDLHPSCFREVDEDVVIGYREEVRIDPATGEPVLERSSDEFEDEDGNSVWDEDEIHAEGKPIIDRIPIVEKQRVRKKAPGILHNHIANYVGYSICLVPKCQTCADKHGVLLEDAKMDANEVLNFRCLFIAEKGWTFLSSDYSNIEMRIAANLSLEPKFIREFLEGDGDFHTLTAIACFPEFTLPGTSKAQRKLLRGLAKIINFALLYGGTVFTIFTNMKKEKPDITWKDAMDMVINYWDSVPIFKGFCEGKQAVARDQFLCTTELGRVVNFHSALETEGLRVPTKAEMDNNWEYIKLRKRFIRAEEEKDEEQALHLKKHMDRLWQDPESGVRNAQYFNKFLGKIQRVSVNVPFQGLAGDFMRICINRVRKWAADQEAGVQAVMRMHSSVHDELDYSVKNQYLPFVVPRITRLMKLRRLHASRKWPVPLEIDTEYGHSWDVTYHFTGDKEHMPSGWTDVEGMEKYLPAEFDLDTCAHLLRAVTSDNPAKVEKARSWMNASLHPHTANAQQAVFEDLKGAPLAVGKREKQLYALLQLHEYWTLDEVPDGDEAGMETLAQFEQRCGLTIADRGFMPEVGYLGAIPLDQVQRPVVPVLGEPEEEPEAPEEPAKSQMDMFAPVEVSPEEEEHEREEAEERERELEREEDCAVMPKLQLPPARVEHATQDTSFDLASFEEAPLAELDEDDLFLPTPKKRARAEVSEADSACVSVLRSPVQPLPTSRPANPRGLPQLRNAMTTEDFKSVMAALGFGSETLECMYRGVTMSFQWNGVNQIPKEFLADGH